MFFWEASSHNNIMLLVIYPQIDGYVCHCEPGYEGIHCEHDIDECLSHPCHNGATCKDLINEWHCICHSGFEGWYQCTFSVRFLQLDNLFIFFVLRVTGFQTVLRTWCEVSVVKCSQPCHTAFCDGQYDKAFIPLSILNSASLFIFSQPCYRIYTMGRNDFDYACSHFILCNFRNIYNDKSQDYQTPKLVCGINIQTTVCVTKLYCTFQSAPCLSILYFYIFHYQVTTVR